MDQETIKRFIEEAHGNAVERGFYDCPSCNGDCFTIEGGAEIGYDAEGNEIQIDGRYQSKCINCNGTGIDPSKNIGELLMLIVSELGEALEAHRCGRFASLDKFTIYMNDKMATPEKLYKNYLSGTFEDEIADVFIRLFDLCGYLEIELSMKDQNIKDYSNFASFFYTLITCYMPFQNEHKYNETFEIKLNYLYSNLVYFCQHHNIPIQKHIEAKMAYNRTRPHKHGKEY